jgi:hypothetical protein
MRSARHGRSPVADALIGQCVPGYPVRGTICHRSHKSPDDTLSSQRADNLQGVRLTMFWDQMGAQFGPVYARSVAKDYVLAGLGGRTVDQALADGEDAGAVWRAVCEAFEVPERLR